MQNLPSESEVLDYASTLSNWGRWGADDELGTINLITPLKRKQAAGLVSDGITVSCAWPITTDPAPDVSRTPIHFMTGTGEGYSLDSDPTEDRARETSSDSPTTATPSRMWTRHRTFS